MSIFNARLAAAGTLVAVLIWLGGVANPRAAVAQAGGACPFYPTASWNGSLPNGCFKNYYLIFPGAMRWNGQGGFCPWDFISIINGSYINECGLASSLVSLGNTLHNMSPGSTFAMLVGPNDCTVNYQGHAISEAAGSLNGILNYVWNNTPPGILDYADMDAEGYGANGSCFQASQSQFGNALSFFQSYFAAGGSARYIGPAGSAPLTPGNEYTLWVTGGGYVIPQIYAPGNQYNWPTSIRGYYWFIQTWPNGQPYYFANDCDANNAFSAYIGQYPSYDFDWQSGSFVLKATNQGGM